MSSNNQNENPSGSVGKVEKKGAFSFFDGLSCGAAIMFALLYANGKYDVVDVNLLKIEKAPHVEYVERRNGERYPLNIEYSLIDACVNASSGSISKDALLKKRATCVCALSDTEHTVSYYDYESNRDYFNEKFYSNVRACGKR